MRFPNYKLEIKNNLNINNSFKERVALKIETFVRLKRKGVWYEVICSDSIKNIDINKPLQVFDFIQDFIKSCYNVQQTYIVNEVDNVNIKISKIQISEKSRIELIELTKRFPIDFLIK